MELELNLQKSVDFERIDHKLGFGVEYRERETTEYRDGLSTNMLDGTATNVILGEAFPLTGFPDQQIPGVGRLPRRCDDDRRLVDYRGTASRQFRPVASQ